MRSASTISGARAARGEFPNRSTTTRSSGVLRQAEHALELDEIDRVKRRQDVTHADAGARLLSQHLHIVEPIEAHDVRDRLAHVPRVERRPDARLDQRRDDRIGDGPAFLLEDNLCDRAAELRISW